MRIDHVKILKSEIESRRARNAAYSLRSFSRFLDLAPSALSGVLKGKKGLSQKKAKFIADKLELEENEREIFLLSAMAKHSRKKSERENALKELETVKNVSILQEKEFALANRWYHFAILELTELPSCLHNPNWFARRLRISIEDAESAIDRMIVLGWLSWDGKRYRANSSSSASSVDIPSRAIKNFHIEILSKAHGAMENQNVGEREFLSSTFSFDSKKIVEAKKVLRDFQKKFSNDFYSKSKNKNSVYQISMQFFRLDEEERK